ncbi:MAG: 3-dehydroquinate synthase [Solirubrobacterales bacterium]
MAAVEAKPALVFIGFMGAGKTVAARAVAGALDEPFVDADEAFAESHGELPAELIEREGEAAFRAAERELVAELLAGERRVIGLGGGAVETPEVRAALSGQVVVWCEVGHEEARRRVEADPAASRPLAADPEAFRERYERRQPIYAELATAVLPEGGPELAARAAPFLAALRELPGARMAWARSASGDYPAYVGRGLLEAGPLGRAAQHGEIGLSERSFCVTDATVGPVYADAIEPLAARIEVEPGEQAKTLAEAERVMRELADAGMTRSDHLVALGGGVVGDLAGFCAATYQRGVDVVQLPTTLVAQVDSAYGGKTGVDLPEAKNYVGAYHQPAAVIADPATLATLPPAELAAGFVEVVKTALLAGGPLWERVRLLDSLEPERFDEVIFDCARTKLAVVAADERDSGHRQVLNLGHTVGHAIESATRYARYRHGEAVGLGLLAALRLSGADGLREEVAGLLERNGLPVELDPDTELDSVLAAVERDKKRTESGVGFVLLERPGAPLIGQRIEADRVRQAVQELVR